MATTRGTIPMETAQTKGNRIVLEVEKDDDGDIACRKCSFLTQLRIIFFVNVVSRLHRGWSRSSSEGGMAERNRKRRASRRSLTALFSEDEEGSSKIEVVKSEPTRENWSGKFEFFLSCLGYCVGFGNIWRFPYLVYRNGGGAFLIPYIVFLRLGYSMALISFFVCIYYNTIMSWVIYYLYASFGSKLPWSWCDPAWASARCFSPSQTHMINSTFSNVSSDLLRTIYGMEANDPRVRVPAAEEYWNRHVLQISQKIEWSTSFRPELLICLALAWISVFICSCKGIKSSGKVVYFTATTPFVMLFVLLIRGATLPGAMNGIKLFIYPDFSRLLDFQVWTDSAMQIFYAMAPGWGGLLSFASYNDFHVNVYKYGVAIPLLNFFTSMLGGFAVFSIIGYLAYQSGVPVGDVVAQGPGLTFVAYPEALSQLRGAPFWSVVFFLTLFTIGIDSQTPFFFLRRGLSAAVLTRIIDYYCAFMTLMIICIVECVLVGWVYGAERFRRDIALMTGHPISRFWCISWKYLTLGTVSLLLFLNFYFQKGIVYEKYEFPSWSVAVGWILAVSSALPIPLCAGFKVYQARGSLWQRVTSTIRCTSDFGPAHSLDRKSYLMDIRNFPPVMGAFSEPLSNLEADLTDLDQTAIPLSQPKQDVRISLD